jgi:hypothetical protein
LATCKRILFLEDWAIWMSLSEFAVTGIKWVLLLSQYTLCLLVRNNKDMLREWEKPHLIINILQKSSVFTGIAQKLLLLVLYHNLV